MPTFVSAPNSEARCGTALRLVEAPRRRDGAAAEDLRTAALAGLSREPGRRTLPCRFFYDEAGSALFERITELPEYYPTRSERALLAEHAPEMLRSAGRPAEVVELGSGSSAKTRLLLDAGLALRPRLHYLPVDISGEFLRESARELLAEYGPEKLAITAVAGEYGDALVALPDPEGDDARLFLFLGSNVGNFDACEAAAFLGGVRTQMRSQDRLLVGIDLAKDRATLEAAYDDAAGVTAAFNKNLLVRLNRELGANFDLSCWEHRATWVEERGRIEMHLVSASDQAVTVAGHSFAFRAGESIHTENSHKYTPDAFDALLRRADLAPVERWTDARRWFSVVLTAPA